MPPSPADLIAPIEQALATLPADSDEYAALASLLDQIRQGRIRKSRVRRLLRFTPRATLTSPQRQSWSINCRAMPTARAPGGILRRNSRCQRGRTHPPAIKGTSEHLSNQDGEPLSISMELKCRVFAPLRLCARLFESYWGMAYFRCGHGAGAPAPVRWSGETGARACQCSAALVSRSGDAGGAAVVAADQGAA